MKSILATILKYPMSKGVLNSLILAWVSAMIKVQLFSIVSYYN
jgi:hypothetical protein